MIIVKIYSGIKERECEYCRKPIFDNDMINITPDGIIHDVDCFMEDVYEQLNIYFMFFRDYEPVW